MIVLGLIGVANPHRTDEGESVENQVEHGSFVGLMGCCDPE